MNDAHDVLTRCRIEGIRKLRDAGCEKPADSFMWFEHYECDRNPMLAHERVAAMGNDSRRAIGRRANESVIVKQAQGETNRYAPNVVDHSSIAASSDPERDAYLGKRYGLKFNTTGTQLGTMKLDANGEEVLDPKRPIGVA